jgi:hypothetical protein
MSSKTGISDEAATGEHDLIHQAELEEQKAHPRDSMTRTPQPGDNNTNLGSTENQGDKHESTLGKVKDTLTGE